MNTIQELGNLHITMFICGMLAFWSAVSLIVSDKQRQYNFALVIQSVWVIALIVWILFRNFTK